MNEYRPDPFESLGQAIEPQAMRPSFARSLRNRLAAQLRLESEIPEVPLTRRSPMTSTPPPAASSAPSTSTESTSTVSTSTPPSAASVATPYITVAGAARAIEWYTQAFGAAEQFRVADDQGRIGHAELDIGGARIMLSDEHPEFDVVSPATLNGTSVAIHLEVADVDVIYSRAVDAGATALRPPADQAHGARHGTLLDPFGHRWMLSQPVENVSLDEYADRASDDGYRVERPRPADGGVWSALFYRDARAGIRFLVDVLGFEERLVVPGSDDTTVMHSELVWAGGGVVQAGTYNPDNPYSRAPGSGGLYLITADPEEVWERCQAAGVDVVEEPQSPDYEPDSMMFSIRDPEGNIFTIGSYAG